MTPKRKAKELVQKFIDVPMLEDFKGMDKDLAKECALIALKEIKSIIIEEMASAIEKDQYWGDVRNEINNF